MYEMEIDSPLVSSNSERRAGFETYVDNTDKPQVEIWNKL